MLSCSKKRILPCCEIERKSPSRGFFHLFIVFGWRNRAEKGEQEESKDYRSFAQGYRDIFGLGKLSENLARCRLGSGSFPFFLKMRFVCLVYFLLSVDSLCFELYWVSKNATKLLYADVAKSLHFTFFAQGWLYLIRSGFDISYISFPKTFLTYENQHENHSGWQNFISRPSPSPHRVIRHTFVEMSRKQIIHFTLN